MELKLIQFLIVCPLVFFAGFVDSVAGGGGLISLPAYLIAGLPVHFAIGTNKVSSFMGTTIATAKYAKSGFIPWEIAIPSVLFALAGSSCGAKLALLLTDRYFKMLILVILPITAVYILRGSALVKEKQPLSLLKTMAVALFSAFVIGIYDGFYGPGTGVFLILLLTGLGHMTLKNANGLSKAINWATNAAAIAVYFTSGKVLLPLGLAAGCFSIIGNYIGARTFERKGAATVRPLMLLVLAIFFIKIITELVGG